MLIVGSLIHHLQVRDAPGWLAVVGGPGAHVCLALRKDVSNASLASMSS